MPIPGETAIHPSVAGLASCDSLIAVYHNHVVLPLISCLGWLALGTNLTSSNSTDRPRINQYNGRNCELWAMSLNYLGVGVS